MTRPRLRSEDLALVDAVLAGADQELAVRHPGQPGTRQPVHTVYVPADRVTADLPARWGAAAQDALDEHAPDPDAMAGVVGADPAAVADAWPLVLAKLEAEPVEDLRIDLEDGYRGTDEDGDAAGAVGETARAAVGGTAPAYWGLRFKCLEAPTRARGLRTLDLALGAALEAGPLPAGFRLTLPKVTSVEQVTAMVLVCERLEAAYALPAGRLGFEVQVETPQAVLGADGTATVARIVHAAEGRCTGLHFGTYDYTAALGIAAGQQALDHPVADHAKQVMMLAAAGTSVPVVDGSTNLLPAGTPGQVRAGWATHFRLVSRALHGGLWQGWDLHPAQLPTRYLATFLFFRAGRDAAVARLADYLGGTGSAVLDEPATVRALAGFLARGLRCGALTADEVAAATTPERLDELTRLRG
ncbi:aldolase [Nocardioides guangzhouensis]|uniref:Aldolase n=1 Tax=Nocardioides guangzhouensis TaxID=2497878 RepID=A0A4Q4ZJ03_9ACTN|nr:aldolase/citrate lyase family protein [Nocardioides guangzhouensis]RYP88262.1 aldolase [Nocardioides guangzhouensis]